MTARPASRMRGISLIEALVALAVVGIGMIGMVGVQATLRGNADVAKQRSTAVRLLQSGTEEWRAFAQLEADPSPDVVGYAEFAAGTTVDAPVADGNASYTRSRNVAELPAPLRGKVLAAMVGWDDRSGEAQAVQMSTVIAGIAPELAATLAIPPDGDPVRRPQRRHRGIPVLAKDLGDGTSAIKPPGAPDTVAWRFDNVTGLVTLCQTAAANDTDDLTTINVVNCAGNATALTGFVRYHLDGTPPTLANALAPGSAPPVPALAVTVDYTLPVAGSTLCYTQDRNVAPFHTAYFCAIPVTLIAATIPGWSGRLTFGPAARIATTVDPADRDPARVRICRYFETSALPDPADTSNDGNYSAVTVPLSNQNYLIVNAGDGVTTFACPTQDAVTKQHQP